MISSIGSSMNSAMMMRGGMQNSPPPGKDAFKVADSDSSGLVSSSELEAVLDGITQTTGTTLNVDETLTTYDADNDGGLSGEEMLALLTDNGFGPPQRVDSESGGPPPPPPPSTDQAMSAYAANSGDDLISQLIEILQGSGSSTETSSPFTTTA